MKNPNSLPRRRPRKNPAHTRALQRGAAARRRLALAPIGSGLRIRCPYRADSYCAILWLSRYLHP